MNNITASFEAFGHDVVQAWESCREVVVTSCENISNAYEERKGQIVGLAREKLHPDQAYIVERVMSAVPEAFVAIAALWGGILTIPAHIISLAGKIGPLSPFIKTVFGGDTSSRGIGLGLESSFQNLDRTFERALVPSLFVALALDSIFSITIGWLINDWSRVLHGTAIALPGAVLAFKYMMYQRTREQSELPPSVLPPSV